MWLLILVSGDITTINPKARKSLSYNQNCVYSLIQLNSGTKYTDRPIFPWLRLTNIIVEHKNATKFYHLWLSLAWKKKLRFTRCFQACCVLFIVLVVHFTWHQLSQRNFCLFLLDIYGIVLEVNRLLFRKCACYHYKTFTRINHSDSLSWSSNCWLQNSFLKLFRFNLLNGKKWQTKLIRLQIKIVICYTP